MHLRELLTYDVPALRRVWESSHFDHIARAGAKGHICGSSAVSLQAPKVPHVESPEPQFGRCVRSLSPSVLSSVKLPRRRECRVERRWGETHGAAQGKVESTMEIRLVRSIARNS